MKCCVLYLRVLVNSAHLMWMLYEYSSFFSLRDDGNILKIDPNSALDLEKKVVLKNNILP